MNPVSKAAVGMITVAMLGACGSGGDSSPVAVSPDTVDNPEPTTPVVEPAPTPEPTPAPAPSKPDPLPPSDRDLAVKVAADVDPLFQNLAIPADAARVGMWTKVVDWPLLAIHASLMPDGKLITFGTPIGETGQGGRVFDVWDPSLGTGALSHVTVDNVQGVDSFCAAAAWLPTGKLLVSGGNSTLDSTIFDPTDNGVSATKKLSSERWYGSLVTLADGRPMITGGSDFYLSETFNNPNQYVDQFDYDVSDRVAMTPEVYTPGVGWSLLPGATSRAAFGPDHNRFWYPRNWVAADGQVFGLSTEQLWRLDPNANAGQGSIEILGTFKGGVDQISRPNVGASSSAVMYEAGKIVQMGGNGYRNGASNADDTEFNYRSHSSNQVTVFDLGNGSKPTITEMAPMLNPRQWHNATVLSDGKVWVSGGTTYANYGGSNAVLDGEMWDPVSNSWTLTAAAKMVRVYHSSALLMPNGTVFTAGGGAPGPANNLNAELFLPPYLFSRQDGQSRLANRPVVRSISLNRVDYASKMALQMSSTDLVADVAIVALGNVTHSFNMSQRRLTARFTQDGFMLEVEMPENGAKAPPGYYMVVVLDAQGVPSKGVLFGLGLEGVQPSSE